MTSRSRPGAPSPPSVLRSAVEQRPASEGAAVLPQCAPSSPSHHRLRLERCTPRHMSPRKFQQLQRASILRSIPLSPLSARRRLERASTSEAKVCKPTRQKPDCHSDHTPWELGWLPKPTPGASNRSTTPRSTRGTSLAPGLSYAAGSFEAWLENYEYDFLRFESLEKFIHVKLPEALEFCEKLETQPPPPPPGSSQFFASRFHHRLRVAVFAHLMERTIMAMARSAAFAHPQTQTILFQARQELFRAIFVDYDRAASAENCSRELATDHERGDTQPNAGFQEADSSDLDSDADSDEDDHGPVPANVSPADASPALSWESRTPRTLRFFLDKLPYTLKLEDDSQRRTLDMKRDQGVLRRIVQTMYQSLGSVFHAWQLFVRQRKDERMHRKGAQLTAMVVLQRGLKRSVFVEWSKATLRGKLLTLQTEHLEQSKQHQQALADLRNEIFLLREKNAVLRAAAQQS